MSGDPTAARDRYAYDRAAHEASVQAWRQARLARLTAADGWLSLVARVPLDPGTSRVGGAEGCEVALPSDKAPPDVGTLRREGAAVTFTPAPGVNVSLRGRAGAVALAPGVAAPVRTDGDGPADQLALGDLTFEVVERPDGMFVRARHPDSPTRRAFTGIEHFPIDPKWRVVAPLERSEPPRPMDLGYEAGSTERYLSPGTARFEIDGMPCRIDPVFDGDRGRLYVVFWDPTARDSTYGAGRFLYAPLPDGDRVLLDFNQAFSPPCAFTPFAACPLAPAQNRLPVRVEAGEKSPH
jgi:uncharacterized protein (DUF1684 family)